MSHPRKPRIPAPTSTAARIGLWLGPVFLLMTLVIPAPGDMPATAWSCVGLALLMATWWSTEAIPIPVTSLLPMAIAPALAVGDIREVASSYAHPIIYLFLGGFLLGIGMQRRNLHRRIALMVLRVVGQEPRRQIAGFMIATGFLSMWVSNTATAIMMLPIGMSVVSLIEGGEPGARQRYATALLLAIAYSASIGGVATLIGTPPNALLAAYLSDSRGIDLGFAQWMLVGLPISIAMMVVTWWWLTRKGFALEAAQDSATLIKGELAKLGKMSAAERRVGIIFLLAAISWMVRPLINDIGVDWLSDTGIAIIAGVILFLTPAGDNSGNRLLNWGDTHDLPGASSCCLVVAWRWPEPLPDLGLPSGSQNSLACLVSSHCC
ncbi:MAG: SLC13 family permease [Halomonas sp.]|uniref:SLC13 family permease n=1 Tax=Halomonas sp. TaxID=1486246 RepID=UPI003F8EDDCC